MRKSSLVLLAAMVAVALAGGVRRAGAVTTAVRKVAIFAGGCFWSMQKAFDGVPGVVSVTAGFAGGAVKNPTYAEVSTGGTGHAESVQVVYDPGKVSYEQLLDLYWHHIDPLTPNQAFCDRGEEYRSIIFYRDAEQKRAAEKSKAALEASHRFRSPIVTAIQPAAPFYAAEEYHQQFYRKNPEHYEAYRVGCRRDERLQQLWGAPGAVPASR